MRLSVPVVTQLMANVIAMTMNAQFNINWYKCFLLDAFIDYRKSNEAVTLSEQKIGVKGKSFIIQQLVGNMLLMEEWKNYLKKVLRLKESHPVQLSNML